MACDWTTTSKVHIGYNTDNLIVMMTAKKVEQHYCKVVAKTEMRYKAEEESHLWEAEEAEKWYIEEKKQCIKDEHWACKIKVQQQKEEMHL